MIAGCSQGHNYLTVAGKCISLIFLYLCPLYFSKTFLLQKVHKIVNSNTRKRTNFNFTGTLFMWTKRNQRSKRFRVNLLQKFALIRSHVRKELTIRKCKTTA